MADTYIAMVNRENVTDWLTNSTSNIVEGTSSDASAVLELRIHQGASITRKDVVMFLESMKRWVQNGGQLTMAASGGDTNLPNL
jgi:hypothetical protein